MVVVGTHTNKGLVKLVLGNHVAELIDIAKPPLLIVPAEVRYKEIQKIAVALNDQDRDLSILNLVSEFAEKLNVELFVFGVAEPQKQTMKR